MAAVPFETRIDAKLLHMVDGKYYDLRSFNDKHPGGERVLRQSLGEDITASVHSHHFTDAPFQAMKKYLVHPDKVQGSIDQTCTYSFKEGGFFETCKGRVVALLGTGVGGVRAPAELFYKAKVATSLVVYSTLWLYCCFRPICWPAMVVCMVLRVVLTGIGHEAIHGRIPVFRQLMDVMILFPADQWHREHVLGHHPHCKRHGLDPDEILAFCRLSEKTPWAPKYFPQVLTQVLVSLLMGPGNVIAERIVEPLIEGRADPVDMLWGIMLLVLTQFVPLMTHPDGFYAGLLVHFVVVMLSNCLILHAFHVSHLNDQTSSLQYDHVDDVDWGEHQLRTTSNWVAVDWAIFSWPASGMLELQIEHHLFPSLTYAQQRRIQEVIRKTAREFNIPYHEFTGLFPGIWAHVCYMWGLSHESPEAKKVKPMFARTLAQGLALATHID